MSGIFINSDAWNFWFGAPIEKMNAQGIREDVDYYAGKGGVEAVFYNMNFQRSFYPTKVGTPFWKDLSLDENGKLLMRGKPVTAENSESDYRAMFLRSKKMNEEFPGFMAYRYKYCHEKGIEMWHSMRMDDVHHTPLKLEHRPQHCDMWLDRKDLIRAWYRHTWRGEWVDNALDYGQPEVYDYHLRMAREYLLDYESDGIELDWLRCAPIFKPGFDEMNTPLLTRFMRDVRKAADEAEAKWGHRIRIAARVPAHVTDAMGMGMDVPTWAREGLIDVLIPSPRDCATEQDTNVALWRILAPAPVILAPCIDCIMSSNPGWSLEYSAATDCGFASNFYQQGADTIYFYNHFPNQAPSHPDLQSVFGFIGDRKLTAAKPRRHVVTKHMQNGEGKFPVHCYPIEIWSHCCNGGVKVNAGEDTAGRKATVVIGGKYPFDITILVNTVPCTPLPADTPLPGNMPGKDGHFVQAEIPAGVLHDGWNDVEIFNNATVTIKDTDIVWMEISLSGK